MNNSRDADACCCACVVHLFLIWRVHQQSANASRRRRQWRECLGHARRDPSVISGLDDDRPDEDETPTRLDLTRLESTRQTVGH